MNNRILVGAIRWDAWVGNLNPVGLEVEKTLLPSIYHNRLPFYTKIKNNGIQIRCDSKDIIQKEIDFAYNAGIHYFAFCWYPFDSGLDTARNLFLEINQNKMKWCIILGTNPFNKQDALWLIKQFSHTNYQKVDNRPIVYLFNIHDELLEIVEFIRKNSSEYNPYFVGMVWNYEQAREMTQKFHLDAISQYCTPGQNNLSYEKLSQKEIDKWNEYSKVNEVIPWVTTGWDKRPRFYHPVSWENCNLFNVEYIQSPTLEELARQMKAAISFQKEKNSKSVLIYAWNEFDEGGFIEPTLSNNEMINKEKLDTIKSIIEQYQ